MREMGLKGAVRGKRCKTTVPEDSGQAASADLHHGRADEIVTARNLVKAQTMRRSRRQNLGLRPLKRKNH